LLEQVLPSFIQQEKLLSGNETTTKLEADDQSILNAVVLKKSSIHLTNKGHH